MSARYLLDTNIFIYVRRQRPPQVLARFRDVKAGEAVISVITYGELIYGVAKSPERVQALKLVEELTAVIPIMPLPLEAAGSYGTIRAALELKGEPIGNNDLWIAAHAMAASLTLVTNNEREFKRIVGLRVQNWVS
jgi:tRNA(fMet)-specific endonuclease VapC